jgi:hypothetical protein
VDKALVYLSELIDGWPNWQQCTYANFLQVNISKAVISFYLLPGPGCLTGSGWQHPYKEGGRF